jgi:hypothetical protein
MYHSSMQVVSRTRHVCTSILNLVQSRSNAIDAMCHRGPLIYLVTRNAQKIRIYIYTQLYRAVRVYSCSTILQLYKE